MGWKPSCRVMGDSRASLLLIVVVSAGMGGCFFASPRSNGEEGVGWKVVMEKREPAYLVAVDATECTVSRERWEEATPGRKFFCHWRRRTP